MKLRGTSPVAEARVAHQVEGPRDAPALLLLQGQANSHDWWQHVRPLLTERFFTITFDYRGTGDTARLQAATGKEDETLWSTALFAEDAAAVLAALDVESAFVYGTSMGGRIAQELAIGRPALVRALVLACTTPGRLARDRTGPGSASRALEPGPHGSAAHDGGPLLHGRLDRRARRV